MSVLTVVPTLQSGADIAKIREIYDVSVTGILYINLTFAVVTIKAWGPFNHGNHVATRIERVCT